MTAQSSAQPQRPARAQSAEAQSASEQSSATQISSGQSPATQSSSGQSSASTGADEFVSAATSAAATSAAASADAATTAGAPAGLLVDDLSVSYGRVNVLNGVDLVVPHGEIAAVLGASGSGKTTLLRSIAGFLRPRRGLIAVEGRSLAGPGVWVPPERRDIGLVPQEGALFPHLDVAGNVGFGLPKRTREQRRLADARVEELLDFVSLSGKGSSRPHELSGGMQQRVALARALAREPKVVLLDEPFSALDSQLRVELRAQVRELLTQAGATAILVTHDEDEAQSFADEVHRIDGGRVTSEAASPKVS